MTAAQKTPKSRPAMTSVGWYASAHLQLAVSSLVAVVSAILFWTVHRLQDEYGGRCADSGAKKGSAQSEMRVKPTHSAQAEGSKQSTVTDTWPLPWNTRALCSSTSVRNTKPAACYAACPARNQNTRATRASALLQQGLARSLSSYSRQQELLLSA